MTTEASKSDHLTALLTQLSHDLEALPGKIAAQVAAEVAAALKPKAPLVRVGGKDLPILSLTQTLAALKKLADKKFGTNEDTKRRALTADFGREISDLILQ